MGKFQMLMESNILNDENMRSSMLTKLMVYILLHREQAISAEDLSVALWQEDEVENPVGALKNLMYRLRQMMKSKFGDNEFVITNVGSYQWNSDIRVTIDIEEFEMMCKLANESKTQEEAIANYEKALYLYQGNFMSKIGELHWVMTLNAYYHSMFLSAIKKLAQLYLEMERYEMMEIVCKNALQYEDADEQLYYYLILARARMNKIKLAQETYQKAQEILLREVGIRDSKKLQEAYRIILKEKKGQESENIKNVSLAMTEANPEGAYLCGYPVFEEIYRLEARRLQRQDDQEFMLMFTIIPASRNFGSLELTEQFYHTKIMEKFQRTLLASLRMCDVVARYSDLQFVLLLPKCSYECSMIVANRIISKFYTSHKEYNNIKIEISLKDLLMTDNITVGLTDGTTDKNVS
jgi:DNA-binding SARP family transcriptional activator/GGDEF domain-containing protein